MLPTITGIRPDNNQCRHSSDSYESSYPSVTQDGQRVGVRPTGAYWGGGNENIDFLSGNLNFTLPLLKTLGCGGWGVPFNLIYNCQNWRQD